MKCAKICNDLGAFVLGGLEPEEAAEVRRHLALCSGCRNELREFEVVNRALESAPPPAETPGHLKGEILSRVRNEGGSSSKKPSFILPIAAAAALVTIVALGIFFSLRAESPVATVQLLPTPELIAEGEDYWGVAELYPQPSGSQLIELKLNNLEDPRPQGFYEMWFVSGERYISAGAFTTTGSGETEVWLTAPPEARNYRSLLITKEAVAGDPAHDKEEILRGEVM